MGLMPPRRRRALGAAILALLCAAAVTTALLAHGPPRSGGPRTGGSPGPGARASSYGSDAGRLPVGVTATGLAVDPATGGYWILRSDGRVDAFRAPFLGSLAGKVPPGVTTTAIAAGHSGGYLVLTSAGAIGAFGAAGYGSDAGRLPAGVTATGLAVDPATGGYWILRSDGRVDAFRAPFLGSLAGKVPPGVTTTAIAAGHSGGYLVLAAAGGQVPRGLAGQVWNVIPTRRKVAALTFDIGPVDGVPSILRTLRRDHVRATFFVTGLAARRHPATVRAIAAAGELVGDHSNNHPHFTQISDRRMGEEVSYARSAIEVDTGLDVRPWFRFPFGDYDARAVAAVNAVGFVPVGWTVDTLGWMGASKGITVPSIVRRILASRRPGEIVLMHGGSDTPGDRSTPDADALAAAISRLRADGYSFVTVDQLLGPTPSGPASNGVVRGFGIRPDRSDPGRLPEQVPAVGLAVDQAGGGYWILRSDGGIDSFHAPALGSLAGQVPAGQVVTAIAAGPGRGFLVLTSGGAVYSFRPAGPGSGR